MTIFQWNGTINNVPNYSVFALADNLETARQIAIDNAPERVRADVRRIVQGGYTNPVSFIYPVVSLLIQE